jgi:hypothetical protein
VELSFRTRQLREFCISPKVDFLALDDIEDLVVRLADLMAADELIDLPWGVAIDASGAGKVLIEINSRWSIEGSLDHVPQPFGDDGLRSTRIRIDEIRGKDRDG